jgi:hypothetical protein
MRICVGSLQLLPVQHQREVFSENTTVAFGSATASDVTTLPFVLFTAFSKMTRPSPA